MKGRDKVFRICILLISGTQYGSIDATLSVLDPNMKKLAFLTAILTFTAFAPAKADYFVWQDPKSGLSLSYPDTWHQASQRQPDEVLTLLAPSSSANEDAVCRFRVREDKRFMIYPPHLHKDVQPVAYSEQFWRDYLNEYDNVDFYGYSDGAGLGRGFGSFAVAGYEAAMFSPYGQRRGIATASLYFGKLYIADCSARAEAFSQFQPLFLSVIGSVDFTKTHDELWTGDYREFLNEAAMQFKWPLKEAVNRY
jgi:hypothetical protein